MTDRYTIIARRADHRCEYCRAPEQLANSVFELEHVFPQSLGGKDDLANMAFACRACNRAKSAHTTGRDVVTGDEVCLFNPRADRWSDHFVFDADSGRIVGLTAIGRATVTRLDMNSPRQLAARLVWVEVGWYP